jgi:hypothetical protein
MGVDENDEYVHLPVENLPEGTAAVWPYADHLLACWTPEEFGHA